ncbi:MAG: hypothetical protein AB7E77_06120 [Desulfobulbus sp.]
MPWNPANPPPSASRPGGVVPAAAPATGHPESALQRTTTHE